MIIPLAAGAGVGTGVVLIARSLRSRDVPLDVVIGRIGGDASAGRRLGMRSLTAWIRGGYSSSTERDLAVTGRSAHRHAVEKLTTPLGLSVICVLFGTAIGVPPAVVVIGALVCGALGITLPDTLLKSAAKSRRDAFRHALSSYLDLVNVLLAGGAGIETSLEAAADAGDGWVFDALRACLVRSRATHRSPWHCFTELGAEYGVDELIELSASVQLAGEQGARIRNSLTAKAASLRAHQLARIEADAQAASERMGLPTVLMFLGFLLLLGYPAAAQIMRS